MTDTFITDQRRSYTARRVVIVGRDNPLTDRPGAALLPWPRRSTGHRLLEITEARTGCGTVEYMRRIGRVNLLLTSEIAGPGPGRAAAYRMTAELRAADIIKDVLPDARLILLGRDVAQAFGMRDAEPLQWTSDKIALMPHPSGRNLWFNDPAHRAAAEIFMQEAYGYASQDPQPEAVA